MNAAGHPPERLTVPPNTHTAPPTLRREGNRDHGPALGKLQGRRYYQDSQNRRYQRPPIVASLVQGQGTPKPHPEAPSVKRTTLFYATPRNHPTLPRPSCGDEAKTATATPNDQRYSPTSVAHYTKYKKMTLQTPSPSNQQTKCKGTPFSQNTANNSRHLPPTSPWREQYRGVVYPKTAGIRALFTLIPTPFNRVGNLHTSMMPSQFEQQSPETAAQPPNGIGIRALYHAPHSTVDTSGTSSNYSRERGGGYQYEHQQYSGE